MSSTASPSPLPPPGYSALQASAGQILLPLTVSNKCGQSFRWRSVQLWEPVRARESHHQSKLERTSPPPIAPPLPKVKQEPKEEQEAVTSSNSQTEQVSHTHSDRSGLEQWTEYSICLSDRVILVRQDEERGYIYHRTLLPGPPTASTNAETAAWLHDYLNLRVPLEALYEEWAEKDKVFARFATKFRGIRMLRQDPWECLCAFICSSNNNIARIGQMVQNLCTHYSPRLLSHTYASDTLSNPAKTEPGSSEAEEETLPMTIDYHPFPSPQALAQPGVEQRLRELGFGYRARYIYETAKMLCEESSAVVEDQVKAEQADRKSKRVKKEEVQVNGDSTATQQSVHSYLQSLRSMSYHEARLELIKLQGVGPKVADCVLLMSLDQASSIPVDRHVFQFAAKWYGLRNAKYETLAEHFRDLWGEYAGWAHSVLFTADLRSFKNYDPSNGLVKKEEDAVKKEEGDVDAAEEPLIDPSIRPRIKVEQVESDATWTTVRTKSLGRSSSGRSVRQVTEIMNGDQPKRKRESNGSA